jgi:zinc protease
MMKHLLTSALLFVGLNVYAAPDIQHWQVNNGARVYFVEAHALPMVDIRIAFDAGSARDGDTPGLAALVNNTMPTGSKQFNEDQLAEIFDNQGARFGHESHRDMSVFTLRSLIKPQQLNPVVEALADILANPTFADAPVKREREHTLVALKHEEQDPGTIGSKTFMAALFGTHPYASWPSGSVDSIKSIYSNRLKGFHRQYYTGKNLTLTIVGNLSTLEAKELANKLVGKLPEGEKAPKPEDVSFPKKPNSQHIDFPSQQTHVLMGYPGVFRGDPDYFPLYVGNHILGGSGLVSLISEEIREKRGLAYSAYSYFYPMRARGSFQIGLQTKNSTRKEALEVIQDTLNTFINNGPSEEDLELAKKNIIGGFALRIDSNSKQAEYVNMIGFYDLPLDYLDTFNQKVRAVTREQIIDAWKRRINPKAMVTVTVGGKASGA